MRSKTFWTALALLAIAGCTEVAMGPETDKVTPTAPGGAPTSASLPAGPLVGPASETLTADEIKEINSLKDPEDAKLALAQKVCPVSYKDGPGHLGEMGAPVKKVIDGKTVFLCCGSCIKSIEADPAKYLAKFPSK